MDIQERDDVLVPMISNCIGTKESIVEKMIENLTSEEKTKVFYEIKNKIQEIEDVKKEKASLLNSNANLRKDVERLTIAQAQNEVLKNAMIKDKYGIELEVAYEV